MNSDDQPSSGRYFFALCPSPREARALLQAHAGQIDALKGRVVARSNLHVTLAFVGSGDESRLCEAAGRVRGRRFDLCFEQARFLRRPRMLWACAAVTPPKLTLLVNNLRDELKVARIPCDGKPFNNHVTLLRKARRKMCLTRVEPVVWRCREFVLLNSETHPQGARYTLRGRWPLQD